jgi:serine/threonine protein kinase
MQTLQTGKQIGNYEIISFVGRGGFALIYLAKNAQGEVFALKIGDITGGGRYVTRFLEITNELKPEGVSPDECSAEAIIFRNDGFQIGFLDCNEIKLMVRTEGYLLGSIRHPNIVAAHDVFEHDGRAVAVLDYVHGKTLREKMRALEGIRVNWFLTIVRALQKMQRSGELPYHGDLKPENVIVKPSGAIVLIDPAMRARDGEIITTTPRYNPLLLRDSKADVMGIGIMLYEILTGVQPFGEAPWEWAGRTKRGDIENLSLSYFLSYVPPEDLNPNTPRQLSRIIYRCLTVFNYGLPELEKDIVEFLSKE